MVPCRYVVREKSEAKTQGQTGPVVNPGPYEANSGSNIDSKCKSLTLNGGFGMTTKNEARPKTQSQTGPVVNPAPTEAVGRAFSDRRRRTVGP